MSINCKSDRRNPSVCLSGRLKTVRKVSAVSIATSEYLFYPPRFREGRGVHASIASSEIHIVMSPRWTSARSYVAQLPTLSGLVIRMDSRVHASSLIAEHVPSWKSRIQPILRSLKHIGSMHQRLFKARVKQIGVLK